MRVQSCRGCVWRGDCRPELREQLDRMHLAARFGPQAECGLWPAVSCRVAALGCTCWVDAHTMCGWRGDCRPRVAGVLHAWLAIRAASTRVKRRVLGRVLGRQTGEIGAGVHSYQPTSNRAQFVQHAHTPPRSTPHDLFPPCSKHLLWPLHQQHQRQRQQLRAQPRRCGLGFQAWLVTPLPLRLV